jgi:PleD family two-component response regulator
MERRRILIGDGEPDFVAEARKALEDSYEVTVASSRKESLEKARRECPDVVIVGFLEPRGDSFKLYKELREDPTTRNTLLLIVDVRPEEHSRKGWRRDERTQVDVECYLTRPVEIPELRETVARSLRSAEPKRMELEEVLEQMEGLLKRVERIEKMLAV